MEVEQILEELVAESDVMLLEHYVYSEGTSARIKLVVDTYEGIRIGQISDLSEKLRQSLLMKEFFPKGFSLEVTSPGLDYPMTRMYQFKRNINRFVRVDHNVIGIPSTVEGVIKSVGDQSISIENEKGLYKIPFDMISKGKLIIK